MRRQLRLVHLQPRPVPGRAGGGARGRAQRPRDASTSCSSADWDRVVVSPGPCTPNEAGISVEVMRRFPEAGVPTLGVCLGHQSLAQAFGGKVIRHVPIHGKTTEIEPRRRRPVRRPARPADRRALPLARRRPATLPDVLEATARGGGVLMAMRHRELPADRRAVPPRVRAHRRTASACWKLPRCLTRPHRAPSTRSPSAPRPVRRADGAPCSPRSWRGNASEVADRGRPDRAAHEGGDGRRARRPGAHDALVRDAGHHRPRRPRRHRRHRRRAADVQRLHDRGADRRRRGLRGGQARQPLGDRAVGLRRRAGGARRRASTSRPRRSPAASTRPASASCSRPPTTGRPASSSPSARSSRCGRSSTSSAR